MLLRGYHTEAAILPTPLGMEIITHQGLKDRGIVEANQ